MPELLSRPNCTQLQIAVHTNPDNKWGAITDKHCLALIEASPYGGIEFPYGIPFAQRVIGVIEDGRWGPLSHTAHIQTVLAVQKALQTMNFDPGFPNGSWGIKTSSAYFKARSACHI